ncbi:MAG: hypothetical protein L0G59_09265 [Kocuria sp.]|nr:hypothetical protein [uncultured Corynebacterium sp.]MDN5605589.1 hypothetical protein [Kocuria sp.]
MSSETATVDQGKNLAVVFVEPPKWMAPAPEVWEQLKPPKKRSGKH